MHSSKNTLEILENGDGYTIRISGRFDLHTLPLHMKKLSKIPAAKVDEIDLRQLDYLDTAAALFLHKTYSLNSLKILIEKESIRQTLDLVQGFKKPPSVAEEKKSFLESLGLKAVVRYEFFLHLLNFIGMLSVKKLSLFLSPKNFRIKEILFEINQSGFKAVGIVALTSFLVGIVIAYQSAVQLELYGANIFIVDMLGISILRELAPMITAIVIAGRSGSAYTAEIGAMKITEELDAMRTMGFDPYFYLVIPRIIALAIVLPILIFIADISGVFGGMIIAKTQLDILPGLFIERFVDVVSVKHFIIGEFKGPFFAFLIATIAIYRGMMVKDDTQSIGKNTTKSVVESIFAVIVADAAFSIIFTHLGL
jgi:phospholipid/cholesterol/gamma-HCH transport system permease protein